MDTDIRKKLHFSLLGVPKIEYNGQEITIPRKTVRILAYYLAAQSEPVHRRALGRLFWQEETSEEQISSHIREHLSKLRASLPEKNLLITRQDLVQFDPEQVSCDVLIFTSRIKELLPKINRYSQNAVFPPAMLSEMESLVSMWRSREFFAVSSLPESDDFDVWLRNTSSQLEMHYASLVETTAAAFLNQRNLSKAIEYVEKIISSENLNLNLHFRFLTQLVDAQQYALARSYCNYIDELAEQAGIPLQDNRIFVLMQQIRDEKTFFTTDDQKKWQKIFNYNLPFVGHEKELVDLGSQRETGIVLIRGDIGSGRSRLAYELYQRFYQHYRPLQIESHPFEELLPYAAITDLFNDFIKEEEWADINPVDLAYVLRQFPGLILKFPHLPKIPELMPDEFHKRILEALYNIFLKLSQKTPVCLCFDDIQYCDNATLIVLNYLFQKNFFPRHGILLITADKNFLDTPKADILGIKSKSFIDHQIKPLTGSHFNQLMNSLVGHPVSSQILETLELETRGNPMLGLSAIIAAVDIKFKDFQNIETIFLNQATNFDEWINNQIDALTPPAKEVLEYCAIMGSHFTPLQLEKATQTSPTVMIAILEELEQKHFIRLVREQNIYFGYGFAHSLFKLAVLNRIGAARKRMIALNVIRAYENSFNHAYERIASILAQHYLNAGDIKNAFDHYVMAARYAESMYSPKDALEAYTAAEKLLGALHSRLTNKEIADFYAAQMEMMIAYGFLDEAQEKSKLLERFGIARGSHFIFGVSHLYRALVKSSFSLILTAPMDDLSEALRYLESCPLSKELLRCKTEIALGKLSLDECDICKDLSLQVIEAIEANPEHWDEWQTIYTRAHYAYASLLIRKADFSEAAVVIDHIIHQNQINFDIVTAINIKILQAWLDYHLGNPLKAIGTLENAIEESRRINNEMLLTMALEYCGRINISLGFYDAGWEQTEQALLLAEKHHLYHIAANALISQGNIMRNFKDFPTVRQYFNLAKEYAAISNNTLTMHSVAAHLALIEGSQDNMLECVIMLRAIMQDFHSLQADYYRIETAANFYLTCVRYDPAEQYSGPLEQEIINLYDEIERRGMEVYSFYLKMVYAMHANNHGNKVLAFNLIHQCIEQSIDQRISIFELTAYQLLHQFGEKLTSAMKERIQILTNELGFSLNNPKLVNYENSFINSMRDLLTTV